MHIYTSPPDAKPPVAQQHLDLGAYPGQAHTVSRKSHQRQTQPNHRGHQQEDHDIITIYINFEGTYDDKSPLQLDGEDKVTIRHTEQSTQDHSRRPSSVLESHKKAFNEVILLLELQVKRSTIAPLMREIPSDMAVQERRKSVRKIFMGNSIKANVRKFTNKKPEPSQGTKRKRNSVSSIDSDLRSQHSSYRVKRLRQ